MINEISFYFLCFLRLFFDLFLGGPKQRLGSVYSQSFIAIGAFHDRHAFLNFLSYSPLHGRRSS